MTTNNIPIITAAEKLAQSVELHITNKANLTNMVLALNEFRMAQVDANEEIGEELEKMHNSSLQTNKTVI